VKLVKHSVALVVRDEEGRFLVVRRPDDPQDPLAGVWGLPAITLRDGEDEHAAAERAGREKLGVTLTVGRKIGEKSVGRGSYALCLSDYEAVITRGTPTVPQPGDGVTQYTECLFTSEPALLAEAAGKGSVCAQIFLEWQRGSLLGVPRQWSGKTGSRRLSRLHRRLPSEIGGLAADRCRRQLGLACLQRRGDLGIVRVKPVQVAVDAGWLW